jgi:hypothetical protein
LLRKAQSCKATLVRKLAWIGRKTDPACSRSIVHPPEFAYLAAMAKYSPIESEFATSEEAEAHDAWVRAKVAKALASKEAKVPHDQVMAEARAIIDKHRDAAADLER